ncbi:protocadherin Fat 4-like, partial [Gigantopelta aegis]|uniref:protocadherin Fat 4-like n=1 Tax=Gigantopelta aegis TaxID=1735272 RepID=UPI001B88CF71
METSVTTVTATDEDGTKQNSEVFYELSGPGSDKFRIDSKKGLIKVAGELDRERNSSYSLTVLATDRGTPPHNGSTTIHVTVTDVNDQLPQFTKDSVKIRVNETTSSGTVFVYRFTATDPDTNHNLSYSLEWSLSSALNNQREKVAIKTLQSVFDINSLNGGISIKGILDRELVETVTLTVKVQDIHGISLQTALATLVIHVLDVNDNAPVFNQNTTYIAKIRENSRGIPISFTNVNAMIISDSDQGVHAQFSISINSTLFEPASNHGQTQTTVQIRVTNTASLDYETTKSYVLMVTASDGTHSNHAFVMVTIIDVNDNNPKFNRTEYNATVFENTTTFIQQPHIQATDDDFKSIVSYSLQGFPEVFAIDNRTGVITIRAAHLLDRETRSSYTLTVTASDGERQVSAPLIITVLDKNDQTPRFNADQYDGTVEEGSTHFNRPVKVQATDNDERGTNNAKIVYSIISGPNNFAINATGGEISINTALDYEGLNVSLGGFVRLTVKAKDLGSPPLSSTVKVTILVEDKNEFAPEFQSTPYVTNTTENSPVGSLVSTISAKDKDGSKPNNEFMYTLESVGLDKFIINSTSGQIHLRNTIDRELDQKQYNLTVVATDRGRVPLSSTTNVLVSIVNVNDEKPTFTPTSVNDEIYENVTVNTIIRSVHAVDLDEDASLLYSIWWNRSTVVAQNMFNINRSTGDIKIIGKLDRETAEVVHLYIHVWDQHEKTNKPQTATASLTVTILDVNDNKPSFNLNQTYKASITENMSPQIPITFDTGNSMTVEDKDK